MKDRAVRSLSNLQTTASTSRVLNLLKAHAKAKTEGELIDPPFFRNVTLNRALIIKHRLRAKATDLFDGFRTSATKIVLPIDSADLRAGGHYAFIGQKGWEPIRSSILGQGGALESAYDRRRSRCWTPSRLSTRSCCAST